MIEAENKRNFRIIEYFKTKCHLKEETLWGKMTAAQDDVNDRLTTIWNLPEPDTDPESDLESTSSEESGQHEVEGGADNKDAEADDSDVEDPPQDNQEPTADDEEVSTMLQPMIHFEEKDTTKDNVGYGCMQSIILLILAIT